MIDYDRLLDRADAIYAELKLKKAGYTREQIMYMAPEQFPRIGSDQIKALARALVDEISEQLGEGK